MASWSGETDNIIPLDNSSLLRAIEILDNERPSSPNIKTNLIDASFFSIVRENLHLRELLKRFLKADREVMNRDIEIGQKGFLYRKTHPRRMRELIEQLEQAIVKQQAAYSDYEMLRRLVCWDNKALERQMSIPRHGL